MRKVLLLVVSVAGLALVCSVLTSAPAGGGATIKLQSEGISVELTLKDGGKMVLTSRPQPIRPGTYTVKSLVVYKQDDKKNVWKLIACENLGTMGTIIVDEGQEKIVDCGPPVVFGFYGKQMPNGTVHFGGSGTGRYGEVYYPCAFQGSAVTLPPPGPPFELRDGDGKPLGGGRFVVAAKNGGLTFDWTPPRGFKGKYTMVLKPALGPFEWKLVDNNFEVK